MKSLADRLWSHVGRNGPIMRAGLTPCWLWTGYKRASGHGMMIRGSRTDGSMRSDGAHRIAWEVTHGASPGDMCVCHHCDNPPCVNPEHLFLGSKADNNLDCQNKGRRPVMRGSKNGASKLVESEVLEIRSLYAGGGVTQYQLADRFGVSQRLINLIVLRKKWSHL